MKIYVKNMVCNRCVMALDGLLKELGFPANSIDLGMVDLDRELTSGQMELLAVRLKELGFELIENTPERMVERIKNAVVKLVHYSEEQLKTNYSQFVEGQLNRDYTYLSNLFSEMEGMTIERYIILQKIEKVKELLAYDELSLAEIADKMGYSSAAYLSSRFKKETGMTPSHYKQLKVKTRKPLDEV